MQGFTILRSVLSVAEVKAIRNSVHDYYAAYNSGVGGALTRVHALQKDAGGWFVAGYDNDPQLRHIATTITSKPALHEALANLLDATHWVGEGKPPHGTYYRLSRTEIYTDRWNAYHSDTVAVPRKSPLRTYQLPVSLWSSAADNETHRIVSVAVYLQDHAHNNRSLRIMPGTHTQPKAKSSELALKPSLGDVVLFDSRLIHRGQGEQYANHKRILTREHHTVLAFSYGRASAFAESHDRFFAMRTLLLNNESICAHTDEERSIACQVKVVLSDVKARPLTREEQKNKPPKGNLLASTPQTRRSKPSSNTHGNRRAYNGLDEPWDERITKNGTSVVLFTPPFRIVLCMEISLGPFSRLLASPATLEKAGTSACRLRVGGQT